MAELHDNKGTLALKGRRIKVTPKVDLTAMVDLAFLLITFFMLTTSLNKSNSLAIAVPDNEKTSVVDVDQRRLFSLIVDHEKVVYYQGNEIAQRRSILTQEKKLRNILEEVKNKVWRTTQKDIIVLIKPTKYASTIDIINTLDEIKKSNIKRYMLSKLTKEDEREIIKRL